MDPKALSCPVRINETRLAPPRTPPAFLSILVMLTLSTSLLSPQSHAQISPVRGSFARMPPRLPLGLIATSTTVSGQAQPEARTVDANTAGEEQLRSIPGIGPATAQRILQTRQRKPFRDLRDFGERVPGIGPKRLQQFSDAGLVVRRLVPVTAPPGDMRAARQVQGKAATDNAPITSLAKTQSGTNSGDGSALKTATNGGASAGGTANASTQASEAVAPEVLIIEGGVREGPYRESTARVRK
jgi:competence protein ComEA